MMTYGSFKSPEKVTGTFKDPIYRGEADVPPVEEILSGRSSYSFNTDMVAPLSNCKIHFAPIQTGTGTPSPSNVRPINGFDELKVYFNDEPITISFPHTVYGGYVDLISGDIVEMYQSFLIDGETPTYRLSKNKMNYIIAMYALPVSGLRGKFKFYSHGTITAGESTGVDYVGRNTVSNYPYNAKATHAIFGTSSSVTATTQYKPWLEANGPLQLVYQRSSNAHTSIDPVILKTIKGINSISTDENFEIDMGYWRKG